MDGGVRLEKHIVEIELDSSSITGYQQARSHVHQVVIASRNPKEHHTMAFHLTRVGIEIRLKLKLNEIHMHMI